jgi:hypothetical protein
MQIAQCIRIRTILSLVTAVGLVGAAACITGCSSHQDKGPDMSKAFQKTAPPAGFSAWQKGQFASGNAPKP